MLLELDTAHHSYHNRADQSARAPHWLAAQSAHMRRESTMRRRTTSALALTVLPQPL